jgi:hypothetical protein
VQESQPSDRRCANAVHSDAAFVLNQKRVRQYQLASTFFSVMLSQEPTKSVLATANCNLTRPEHQRKQPIEQGAFRWHELRGLKPSGCSRPDTMQGPTCLGIGSSSRALHSPVHRQQSRLRPAKVLQTPRPGGVSDGDSTADQRKLLNELLKRSGTPHEVVAKTSIPQPVAVSTAPAGSKVGAWARVKAPCTAWTVAGHS